MSLKFGILAILASNGPQAGYDIKTYFERGPSHVWYADLPQIYRTLDQLENAGHVSVEADPENPRNRKVYTITPTGREALQTWLEEDFEWGPVREPNLLKIFFGALIPPEKLKQQITDFRNKLTEANTYYRQVAAGLPQETVGYSNEAFFWFITLSSGQKISQALIEWCDDALKQMEQREQQS
jgi:PadR family transcriptional regulator AphA